MNTLQILRPQDVVLCLRLSLPAGEALSNVQLAEATGISAAETHAGVKRLERAKLVQRRKGQVRVLRSAFEEFLVHGVKYMFVSIQGEPTRGMPTSYAAAPLNQSLVPSGDLPPVWPDPLGEVRGLAFSPLYKSVPQAAKRDPRFYEVLALTDALRGGRVRERSLAEAALKEHLRDVTL